MKCHRYFSALLLIGALTFGIVPLAAQTQLEVVHWWTSKGEARSVDVIKKTFLKTGDYWADAQVPGGAGRNLIKLLKGRLSAGNPPSVVQVYMGPSVWMWAAEGGLVDLSEISEKMGWEKVLPGVIRQMIQLDGKTIAVPVNAHRVNWMWINPVVFQQANVPLPKNWSQFWEAAEKISETGYIPVAIGGEPWQVSTLFENILLGIGGVHLHRKVFNELDLEAVRSSTMEQVFETMRRIQRYTDVDAPGRSWDKTTELVMQGKAAVQFMGDWAKGEFLALGKQRGKDFLCLPTFGTETLFLIDTDTFMMFESGDPMVRAAQLNLAQIIMSPEVQEQFNLYKGSIPARLDIPDDRFDQCGKDAMSAFKKSAAEDTVIPAFTFSQATSLDLQEPLMELINAHFNSDMTSKMAVDKFAAIIRLYK